MKQSKLLFLLIAALAFASCRPTAQQTVADAEQPTDSTEAVTSADTLRLVSRSGETTAIGEIDTKTGKMTFDSEAWYTLDPERQAQHQGHLYQQWQKGRD